MYSMVNSKKAHHSEWFRRPAAAQSEGTLPLNRKETQRCSEFLTADRTAACVGECLTPGHMIWLGRSALRPCASKRCSSNA